MERPRRAILLFLLALVPAAALAQAQEPTFVRLNNDVGDTLDLAERDSFHLFPKTAEFRDAVVLALPGPEFFAKIRRTGPDSTPSIFLRIMPEDLQRIRFLVDNHESVAAQQRSDSAYARGLASFWQTIEEHPLRNMAGEPAIAPQIPRAPTETTTAGRPQPKPAAGVVWLSDAVGDTIDLAERDSFRLFPNITGFRNAVILARPGPEFYAEVTLATADTAKQVFYRIMPGDLQRLRFLINNHEYVAGQQQSDSTVVQSLASFWQSIEEHPLRSTAGEPANAQEFPSAPAQAATAGRLQPDSVAVTLQPSPAMVENRYNYALHGIACGSAVGGCIGFVDRAYVSAQREP